MGGLLARPLEKKDQLGKQNNLKRLVSSKAVMRPAVNGEIAGSIPASPARNRKRKPMGLDLVDRINAKKANKGNKLIKLYSVVMLYYRQPLGDKAWKGIEELFGDKDLVSAFAFITGFLTAFNLSTDNLDRFKDFIKEELNSK